MTGVIDKPLAVAYPGRDGAHSAAACERLFPTGAELRPLPSFLAVAEATVGAKARARWTACSSVSVSPCAGELSVAIAMVAVRTVRTVWTVRAVWTWRISRMVLQTPCAEKCVRKIPDEI